MLFNSALETVRAASESLKQQICAPSESNKLYAECEALAGGVSRAAASFRRLVDSQKAKSSTEAPGAGTMTLSEHPLSVALGKIISEKLLEVLTAARCLGQATLVGAARADAPEALVSANSLIKVTAAAVRTLFDAVKRLSGSDAPAIALRAHLHRQLLSLLLDVLAVGPGGPDGSTSPPASFGFLLFGPRFDAGRGGDNVCFKELSRAVIQGILVNDFVMNAWGPTDAAASPALTLFINALEAATTLLKDYLPFIKEMLSYMQELDPQGPDADSVYKESLLLWRGRAALGRYVALLRAFKGDGAVSLAMQSLIPAVASLLPPGDAGGITLPAEPATEPPTAVESSLAMVEDRLQRAAVAPSGADSSSEAYAALLGYALVVSVRRRTPLPPAYLDLLLTPFATQAPSPDLTTLRCFAISARLIYLQQAAAAGPDGRDQVARLLALRRRVLIGYKPHLSPAPPLSQHASHEDAPKALGSSLFQQLEEDLMHDERFAN